MASIKRNGSQEGRVLSASTVLGKTGHEAVDLVFLLFNGMNGKATGNRVAPSAVAGNAESTKAIALEGEALGLIVARL